MLKIKILIAVLLGFSSLSLAAGSGDSAGWVGGQFGLSVPNAQNTTSRSNMAITGGAKVGSEFGVGAYYQTSRKDESVNGVSTPWNYDLYGVMAGYFFEGEAKGVYLGGLLGMSKVGTKTAGGLDVSTSPMHWGLVAGYDHMLAQHFSLGGEVTYISVASSSTTVAATTVTTDAFSTLNFMVSGKFWF